MERTIQTGHEPHIQIDNIQGSLIVRGWDQPTLHIRTGEECTVQVMRNGATQDSAWAESSPATGAETGTETAHSEEENHARHEDSPAQADAADASATHVRLDCPNDAVISLPFNSRIRINAVASDCNIKELGEVLHMGNVGGDCRIVETGGVELNTVGGDCVIQVADGPVTLHTVGGDLRVQEAGNIAIVRVGGDASLQKIRGHAECGQAGGDLRARDIQGHFHGEGRGDVNLSDIDGNIQAVAGGTLHFALDLASGQHINAQARGDIRGRIPTHALARVHYRNRDDFQIRNLDTEAEEMGPRAGTFRLGAADNDAAVLNLDAGGGIVLIGVEGATETTGEAGEFAGWGASMRMDDLADLMSRQLESRLEHLSHNLEARLSNSDDLAARIQEKVQNAMRQAERKIAKALEKAESRARRAEEEMARREARRAERENRAGRRYGPGSSSVAYSYTTPPTPPVPPRPPKASPVTDEERMRILRMVEQGKISVEQAEKLLAALQKPGS